MSGPEGNFAAQNGWILNNYINLTGSYAVNTWGPHDVAVCRMNKNSAGKTLAQTRRCNSNNIVPLCNVGGC